MQKLICVAGFFYLINICHSQSLWYITRGGQLDDQAWGVDADSSGNIYWAVSEMISQGDLDIKLYKIDSDAVEEWQSAFWGLPYLDLAYNVTVKDPNVYVGGRIDSGSATLKLEKDDALILNYDGSTGNLNWPYIYNPSPDYGYEEVDGLIIQPDGIYFSGFTTAPNDTMDFLIQKIDFFGQPVWTNRWGTDDFDGANGHMVADDKYLYIAGSYNGSAYFLNLPVNADMVLACFSRANGTYQWHVTWSGGIWYNDAFGMNMSSDSMLYIVGITGNAGNGSQAYLRKYTRTGQLMWSRVWGGAGTEDCRSAVADGDSMIYVAGSTSSYGNGAKDIFILKYDSAGTLLDSLFWGGPYDEIAHDVAIAGDYLYITGETKSFGNGQIIGDHKSDGLLLKVNGRTMLAPDTTITSMNGGFRKPDDLLQIYPNLNNGKLEIRNCLPDGQTGKLEIYNMFGEQVYLEKISNFKSQIHLNLPGGIYFLKIATNGFFVTKKLIIQ